MLEYMHVKNLALIKDCEIQFTKGLNILTGETGAGKSILLGSVNLALGAKADTGLIRTGEEEAYVELVFSLAKNEEIKALLSEMELSADEDFCSISRKITPTKSIFKINGEIVTGKQVKTIAGGLLDVHGQHEHQSLLSNLKQRDMLDAFGGAKIEKALKLTKEKAIEYTKLKEELNKALDAASGREREISLLKYELEEIDKAQLIVGEDEELEENYKRMKASEKLLGLVSEAFQYVSFGTKEDAGSLISKALYSMNRAGAIDGAALEMSALLSEAEEILGDFSIKASKYMDSLEFPEEEFKKTEERLNVINNLKLKFENSIQKILDYYEEKASELEKLEHLDEYLEKLTLDTNNALSEYKAAAEKLSGLRKEKALEFEKLLSNELLALSFNFADFKIDFDTDTEKINEKGFDNIDFLISTNIGEPLKPMRNVSSGGELSRIMLAIKTILASKDKVDALIFDEIDAGISGRTAWEVAGRLNKLSKEHQVILISHLAQIAAMADTHFEIEKSFSEGTTTTKIFKLDEEGEIKELARLLGSDELNQASIDNARELKKKAREEKRG